MARIRSIKPEFPQSESMGKVSREARLCFILLWTLADDAGRLRGNSRMLASLLYPYDDDAKDKMDGWLSELSAEGCVARYEVDSTSYVQICAWLEHQKIDKPSASKIPEHPKSRKVAKPREDSSTPAGKDVAEGKGVEGSGEDGAATEAVTPPALTLLLNDKSEHPVWQKDVEDWQEAYPAVDVLQELREMRQWCITHPENRKTQRGIGAFIMRWLGKEQDKGGPTKKRAEQESFV